MPRDICFAFKTSFLNNVLNIYLYFHIQQIQGEMYSEYNTTVYRCSSLPKTFWYPPIKMGSGISAGMHNDIVLFRINF